MKAIYRERFGSSEVLDFREIDRPIPAAGEVLIRVRAAGINPGDVHEMRGVPYAARLMGYGLTRPKHATPGADLAGVVEAVGTGVTRFTPGDEVFGWGIGAFAEYAVAAEASIAAKPSHLTFEQAAAVPTASVAALQALRTVGEVEHGHQVLVVGASGGVGTFAVQIARAYGALVTAVASGGNAEMVRSTGAASVIDYAQEDFTAGAARFDVVVDLVGKQPLAKASRVLAPDGTYVVVGGGGANSLTGMERFAKALLLSPVLRRRLRPLFSTKNGEHLTIVAELIEAGKVLPVIDSVFDLRDTPDALDYVARGHARGKVVVSL